MRALYPAGARRDGLEGDVSLRILVSTSGEVLKVKVVKPAGNGFEEAATAIVKRFQFRAAEVGGQPVEVWIPWTYKFRLEG
ncbi:MAG: energy transducer TonB [Myxococcales bacterium]